VDTINRDENREDAAMVYRDAETEQRGIVSFQNNMIHLYMSLKADNNYMKLFYILYFQIISVLLRLN